MKQTTTAFTAPPTHQLGVGLQTKNPQASQNVSSSNMHSDLTLAPLLAAAPTEPGPKFIVDGVDYYKSLFSFSKPPTCDLTL